MSAASRVYISNNSNQFSGFPFQLFANVQKGEKKNGTDRWSDEKGGMGR